MEISRIKVPLNESGIEITVDIKDRVARETLASISQHINGSMSYLGETTSPISSGSGINPIEINGYDFTATAGTCVMHRGNIFLYNGITWHEFGSVGALKALAYKDEVEAEYTPEGYISKPQFIGKESVMYASVVPRGRVDILQESADEETANFIAEGTVTAPTITIVPETKTIVSVTSSGRKPSCKFPSLNMHLEGEGLVFGWTDGTFDAGSGIGGSEEVTVMTGITEVRSSQPQFSGKPQKITGAFYGQGSEISLEYTPEGEITAPRFEGIPTTIRSS